MKILIVFGTRPEAIKMAPIIKELQLRKQSGADVDYIVCITGQHKQMLRQVMDVFDIKEDIDLDVFESGQSLTSITTKSLIGLEGVIKDIKPDIMLVQGDTTAVFSGALAAFYQKVAIGHIEAGLRSFELYSPYPEEANRRLTSVLTKFHFAPTKRNVENLLNEGYMEDDIYLTGNTVIDALKYSVKDDYIFQDDSLRALDFTNKRIILLTSHRRENIGQPMEDIFSAMRDIVDEYEDVEVVFPMHKNPLVREIAKKHFENCSRIHLIEPLDYEPFVNLMNKVSFIVSDSGGIQEEGPALGKPVLVIRRDTERPEGVEAGTARLTGVHYNRVYRDIKMLLDDEDMYNSMAKAINPYGDGFAAKRIVDILLNNERL